MTDDAKRFYFNNINWKCCIAFYHDRMEYVWDFAGIGIDKGRRSFSWQELAPDLGKSEGRAKDPTRQLRLAGCYFAVAILLFYYLPSVWRFVAYLALGWALFAAYCGVRFLRTRKWIQIFKTDGSLAVSVHISNWSAEEETAFKDFFVNWLNSRG
jgi:hypothetical protein